MHPKGAYFSGRGMWKSSESMSLTMTFGWRSQTREKGASLFLRKREKRRCLA